MSSFCLSGSIRFHSRLTSAAVGAWTSSASSFARFASMNDGRAEASTPATAPSRAVDAPRPAGPDGTSETGPEATPERGATTEARETGLTSEGLDREAVDTEAVDTEALDTEAFDTDAV